MSDLPRLFVSHSSLDTDLTRQVCDRLAPAPGKPGYDILVDYVELKPGVDWPRHLHEYMAHCHAAVLLLSRNAAASPWVLKEATILAWRRSLDPSFQLFPVCLTDVDDALFEKQKFGPLMFGLIQKIGSADPEIIANSIRAQVGQPNVRSPTPFDRLVGRLKDLLSQVGPETLKEIAEKMSVQIPAWRPDIDRHTQYVTQIARRILSEDMGGFKGVDDLIDALSFTPAPDNVNQIFGIIAPLLGRCTSSRASSATVDGDGAAGGGTERRANQRLHR
jgi:TIR domain